jgi:hypothetical protein
MTIPTISGVENITKLANASMFATVKSLQKENLLSEETANFILDNYAAIYVDPKEGGFVSWLKNKITPSEPFIVVAKMISTR